MEQLRVDGARGQNYGYTLYRAHVPGPASQLAFTDLPQDRAQVNKIMLMHVCVKSIRNTIISGIDKQKNNNACVTNNS